MEAEMKPQNDQNFDPTTAANSYFDHNISSKIQSCDQIAHLTSEKNEKTEKARAPIPPSSSPHSSTTKYPMVRPTEAAVAITIYNSTKLAVEPERHGEDKDSPADALTLVDITIIGFSLARSKASLPPSKRNKNLRMGALVPPSPTDHPWDRKLEQVPK